MKIFAVATLISIALAWAASAGEPFRGSGGPFLGVFGWNDASTLPTRFRNHCSSNVTYARNYCSDHCGSDYEFYYCSRKSFGCCHVGVGYCDWDGLLRCHP